MPLTAWRPHFGQQGFTLAEMLTVIIIIALLAIATLPSLNTLATPQDDLMATEVAGLLRLAVSEARRSGQFVLVDGKTQPGTLKVYLSNASAEQPPTAGTSAVLDPLTRQALSLSTADSPLLGNAELQAKFNASGVWQQLLIAPGAQQFRAFDGAGSDRGALTAGSGILLSGRSGNRFIAIQEVTGLVTGP